MNPNLAPSARRQPQRLHQIGTCQSCGRDVLGITTVEHRPWDRERPEHRFHFCERCSDRIRERPLDEVLREYLG